jgi:hypothetical protein
VASQPIHENRTEEGVLVKLLVAVQQCNSELRGVMALEEDVTDLLQTKSCKDQPSSNRGSYSRIPQSSALLETSTSVHLSCYPIAYNTADMCFQGAHATYGYIVIGSIADRPSEAGHSVLFIGSASTIFSTSYRSHSCSMFSEPSDAYFYADLIGDSTEERNLGMLSGWSQM